MQIWLDECASVCASALFDLLTFVHGTLAHLGQIVLAFEV